MLVTCSRCRRLVRRPDGACPFCGTPVGTGATPQVRSRMSRAAMMAAGAAAIASASGCSQAVYGAVCAPAECVYPVPQPDAASDATSDAANLDAGDADAKPDGDGSADGATDAASDAAADADGS